MTCFENESAKPASLFKRTYLQRLFHMKSSDKGIKLPDNLIPAQDRVAGAIIGVLIGDAMAVGPIWYYDLDEMRQAYGGRITDYVPVLPNRYHVGVELGDVSQSGQFNQLLIESVVACGG